MYKCLVILYPSFIASQLVKKSGFTKVISIERWYSSITDAQTALVPTPHTNYLSPGVGRKGGREGGREVNSVQVPHDRTSCSVVLVHLS